MMTPCSSSARDVITKGKARKATAAPRSRRIKARTIYHKENSTGGRASVSWHNRKEPMTKIEKYSIGVGDRFAHQARAQLRACLLAADAGMAVIPVLNKSNPDHMIIGAEPASLRAAADGAVAGRDRA